MDTINQFAKLYLDINKDKNISKQNECTIASNYQGTYDMVRNRLSYLHENSCFDMDDYKNVIENKSRWLEDDDNPRIWFSMKKIDYKLPEDYALFFECFRDKYKLLMTKNKFSFI